jgi:hypothetical protein
LSLDPELSQGIWPSTTDLVFNPGTTKLTLNLQRGPLRAILHDAFEKLRAFLLLNNSFPDATTLPMVIKNCLITAAAESHYPSASDIRERLTQDDKYMDRLSRLVRVFILFNYYFTDYTFSRVLVSPFTAQMSRSAVQLLSRPLSW